MNWAAVTGKDRPLPHHQAYLRRTRPASDRETNDLDEFLDPLGAPSMQQAGGFTPGSIPNMELYRPYQQAAREAVENCWGTRGERQHPAFYSHRLRKDCHFCENCRGQGAAGRPRAHPRAPRRAARSGRRQAHTATGLSCATKAEQSCLGSWLRVAVGSVQTLCGPSAWRRSRGITSAPSSSTKRITRYPTSYGRSSTTSTAQRCSA